MSRQSGDSHRRFSQTSMAIGITDEQEARALYQHCCETHKTQCAPDKSDEFIEAINSRLQPMFMQIRKGMSEENGNQYYALVNMAESEITRMTSDYADNESESFRKTVDLIVSSENGKASSTDISNSTDTMTSKKSKKSETEHLLTRSVQDKWLCELAYHSGNVGASEMEASPSSLVMEEIIKARGLHSVHSMHYRDGAIFSHNVSRPGQNVPHSSQHCLSVPNM